MALAQVTPWTLLQTARSAQKVPAKQPQCPQAPVSSVVRDCFATGAAMCAGALLPETPTSRPVTTCPWLPVAARGIHQHPDSGSQPPRTWVTGDWASGLAPFKAQCPFLGFGGWVFFFSFKFPLLWAKACPLLQGEAGRAGLQPSSHSWILQAEVRRCVNLLQSSLRGRLRARCFSLNTAPPPHALNQHLSY